MRATIGLCLCAIRLPARVSIAILWLDYEYGAQKMSERHHRMELERRRQLREARALSKLRATVPGADPRPVSLILYADVPRERNVWCPAYEHCLDAAILADWPSWSCVSCTHKEKRDQPVADGEARDTTRVGG